MTDPFVVVGGDAAGLSAASKCKREDPDRDVVVFEEGSWVSYAQCGMPYYVKGEVDSLSSLLSLTPAEIDERGIDLRRGHEVVAIDPDAQTVTVTDGTDRHTQAYDDLLIATGAHAISEVVPGAGLDGVFTIHDMDATAALRAYLRPATDQPAIDLAFVDRDRVDRYAAMDPPESAVIVGGGYVGVEMAEALRAHDLAVDLFQRPDQLVPPFGDAVGELVAERLRDNGVGVHLGTEVEELVGREPVEGVVVRDEVVDADLVVLGVGIRPNVAFLEGADIDRGDSGAIATDEYGRTSRENVYAAGDCAEMRHVVTDELDWVPLGLTANRAGRAIGQTVAGDPTPVGEIAGTAALKAFDLECARTGIVDGAKAQASGFEPVSETITAGSRSGYYPGSAETTVTLVADADTGRLLGGTIAGEDRAAVRIDTIATALSSELSIAEVERLDLAYAPPFSPVWDPVLVAAKVLHGTLDDM